MESTTCKSVSSCAVVGCVWVTSMGERGNNRDIKGFLIYLQIDFLFLEVLYYHLSQVRTNNVYILLLTLPYQYMYFNSQSYFGIYSNLIVWHLMVSTSVCSFLVKGYCSPQSYCLTLLVHMELYVFLVQLLYSLVTCISSHSS